MLSHEDPHILNKKTGEITKLRREGNVYVVDLWIKVLHPARSNASAKSDSKAAVQPGAKTSGEKNSKRWSKGDGSLMDIDLVERIKTSHFTRQARRRATRENISQGLARTMPLGVAGP